MMEVCRAKVAKSLRPAQLHPRPSSRTPPRPPSATNPSTRWWTLSACVASRTPSRRSARWDASADDGLGAAGASAARRRRAHLSARARSQSDARMAEQHTGSLRHSTRGTVGVLLEQGYRRRGAGGGFGDTGVSDVSPRDDVLHRRDTARRGDEAFRRVAGTRSRIASFRVNMAIKRCTIRVRFGAPRCQSTRPTNQWGTTVAM